MFILKLFEEKGTSVFLLLISDFITFLIIKLWVTACTSFIFHYFIFCLHEMKLIADMGIVAINSDIIQLMHSFEVNIKICQPENSEAEVNITFEGWLILVLIEKECTNCFVIWHCLSFSCFILSIFIFINLLKSDVPCALSLGRLFQQSTSKIWWDKQNNCI